MTEEKIEEEEEISDVKVRKLKNLKMFRNMSDEEVRQYIRNRPKVSKPTEPLFVKEETKTPEMEYDEEEYRKKYKEYMRKYLKEYGVDMNDANDAQALESLVKLIIQFEVIDENIMKLQRTKGFDSRTLKNMGDYQRSVQTSITELQDRLGISRKMRKEKQVDDIPQYIRELQLKARDFWNRTTTSVRCQKCQVELARYWLNFPDRVEEVSFHIVCDKCQEKLIYNA